MLCIGTWVQNARGILQSASTNFLEGLFLSLWKSFRFFGVICLIYFPSELYLSKSSKLPTKACFKKRFFARENLTERRLRKARREQRRSERGRALKVPKSPRAVTSAFSPYARKVCKVPTFPFPGGKWNWGAQEVGNEGRGSVARHRDPPTLFFLSKFLQVIIWNGESLPSAWGPDGNGASSDVDAAALPSFLARQWGREGGNHFHLSLLILFHLFFFMPPYYPISRVEKSCSNSCQKLFTVYGLKICKQTILPVLRHRAGRLNGGGPPRHSSDTGQREGNDRRPELPWHKTSLFILFSLEHGSGPM